MSVEVGGSVIETTTEDLFGGAANQTLLARNDLGRHRDRLNFMVTNDLISGMFKGLSIGADPFRDEYRVDAYAARSGRGPGVSRNDFSVGAKTMRLLRPDVARSPFGGYTAWRGPTSVAALVEDADWLRYQDMHASGDIRRLQNVHGAALLTELGVQVAVSGLSTAAGVGALGYHAQMAALGIGAGFSADAAGTAFGSGNYGEGTAHAALSVTAAFSLGSNIASSVASRAGLNAGKGAPYEFGRSLHQGHGVRAAHMRANPPIRMQAAHCPTCGNGVCFVAGTQVLTSEGSVSIEDIREGDLVWSRDEATGESGLQRVSQIFGSHPEELVHVQISAGDELIGTPTHPFRVELTGGIESAWIEMGELRPGMVLIADDATTRTVTSTSREFADPGKTFTTYNFEVENWHTYFVAPAGGIGDGGFVWVHNACPRTYSVAFEMQLDVAQLGLSRARHFDIANEALEAARAADANLADMVSAPLGWGRPPEGWVWQHATKAQGRGRVGVLQLVPKAQHSPDSPFWPILHPLPNGGGGYTEWAIPAGAPRN